VTKFQREDLTESSACEARIVHALHGRLQPNRSLAERLAVIHRIAYELSVAVPTSEPEPLTREEKLLRSIFGRAADGRMKYDTPPVGTTIRRGAWLIGGSPPRVTFREAEACEIEKTERVITELPDGRAERITVFVRFDGPLTLGDTLRVDGEVLGVVDGIVDDGDSDPLLYASSGNINRVVRIDRVLPTASQRMFGRSVGDYELRTRLPETGAVLRDDQLEWLARSGGRTIVSEVAAYTMGDRVLGLRLYEELVGGGAITDGFSAARPHWAGRRPAPQSSSTISALFPAFTGLARFLEAKRIARAAGLALERSPGGIALHLDPPSSTTWSHGEVTSAATWDARRMPVTRGLACAQIFGPLLDYECLCGRYANVKHRGVVCERCGVEVTASTVRLERFGHVVLKAPITPRRSRVPWNAVPILPPDLRTPELNLAYAKLIETGAQAAVDAVVERTAELCIETLAPRMPRRTDYSGGAVALVGERCRVPWQLIAQIASPILMGICESLGWARTIKGAKKILLHEPGVVRELVQMAMHERVLLLGGRNDALVGAPVELGDDPVIELDVATASRIGAASGDIVSVWLPVSDAGQAAARSLYEGSTPLGSTASWIREVIQAADPVAELFERAANDDVDSCTWPIAALLVGGYDLDGPPPRPIRNGPSPNIIRLPERE
jgi:hypothetical protein